MICSSKRERLALEMAEKFSSNWFRNVQIGLELSKLVQKSSPSTSQTVKIERGQKSLTSKSGAKSLERLALEMTKKKVEFWYF